jgi:hypothetical protein
LKTIVQGVKPLWIDLLAPWSSNYSVKEMESGGRGGTATAFSNGITEREREDVLMCLVYESESKGFWGDACPHLTRLGEIVSPLREDGSVLLFV